MNNIMDTIMAEVKKGDLNLSESEEKIFIEAIEEAKKQKLNIMFVGATGVGKSSTINAIFNTEVDVDPHSASAGSYSGQVYFSIMCE